MNRYNYFVNDEPMSRKEMSLRLQKHFQEVVQRIPCGALGYIEVTELNEKRYNYYFSEICRGIRVIFRDEIYRRELNA